MFPRHMGYEVAIVTVICTVAIFLFPAASGPYSAVHGPATALLSMRTRLRLWLRMALEAMQLTGRTLLNSFEALLIALQNALLPQSVPPERMAILRC
jgi:hypothetical protein